MLLRGVNPDIVCVQGRWVSKAFLQWAQNSIYIISFYLKIILCRSCISYKFFYASFLIEILCNLTYSIICLTCPRVANTRSLMFGRVGKLVPACCEPALQFWVVLKLILLTPHTQEFDPVLVMQLILLSQTHVEFETTNTIRKCAVPCRMRNDYRVTAVCKDNDTHVEF